MEKEAFENKLKQAKREKEAVEEEFLSASDKWRAEKRKLNSEIDRLELALLEAKGAASRKRGGGDSKSNSDSASLVKIQEAADQKIAKANEAWDAERAKLKSQIARLENAVAEAIARAANPMRATQTVREQFESELAKVAKEKTELEQAYLRLKTESEQDKLKMTGELVKLRRAAQIMGRPVPKDGPEVNPRIRDLETQLQDSLTRWNSEREQLVGNLQKLETAAREWDSERRQLNDHAGQLQQAFVQAQATIQSFQAAQQSSGQSDRKVQDLQRQKNSLERDFQEARDTWTAERRRTGEHVERLEQQLQRMSDARERVNDELVDQLRKQYDQKLQEAIQQKTQLSQQLQDASKLLEAERARLAEVLTQQAGNDGGTKGDGGSLDANAIKAEIERVEKLIGEIVSVIDNPETELSTVIRKNVEKAELDSYLKGILFSLGRSQS